MIEVKFVCVEQEVLETDTVFCNKQRKHWCWTTTVNSLTTTSPLYLEHNMENLTDPFFTEILNTPWQETQTQ